MSARSVYTKCIGFMKTEYIFSRPTGRGCVRAQPSRPTAATAVRGCLPMLVLGLVQYPAASFDGQFCLIGRTFPPVRRSQLTLLRSRFLRRTLTS